MYSLEDSIRAFGLPYLAQILGAELTIYTKTHGAYAVFRPRACLWIEDGKLAIGHPAGARRLFARAEIRAVKSGVSISPAYPGLTFQRIVAEV